MPKFYFDVPEGAYGRDLEGLEMVDLATATREAIRFCGETLKGNPDYLQPGFWQIIVRGDDGANLVCITVSVDGIRCAGEPQI